VHPQVVFDYTPNRKRELLIKFDELLRQADQRVVHLTHQVEMLKRRLQREKVAPGPNSTLVASRKTRVFTFRGRTARFP